MRISTKHFGEIEVDPQKVISFENGIPGFEQERRFLLIDNEDAQSPFKWLQSINAGELAFAVVNPFAIRQDYDFLLNEDVVNSLAIEKEEDVAVFSIVVVPEDISQISMNLKAPVVINVKDRKGAQIVLDTDRYSVRHYILEELRRQEVAVNACSDKEEGSDHCNK